MKTKKRKVITFRPNEIVLRALQFWGYINKHTGANNSAKNLSELLNRLIMSKLRYDAQDDIISAINLLRWQLIEVQDERDKEYNEKCVRMQEIAKEIELLKKRKDTRK